MLGVCDANGKPMLAPAFINAVNHYLARYNPILEKREENHVKMTARYGYLLDIELVISGQEYEVIVTVTQEKYDYKKAQSTCMKTAKNVNKVFTDYLIKGSKIRSQTNLE